MSNIEADEKASELNESFNQNQTQKGWVKFDDENPQTSSPLTEVSQENSTAKAEKVSESSTTLPAVLKTETVHVNLERSERNVENTGQGNLTKNVEFVNVRQGFCKYKGY